MKRLISVYLLFALLFFLVGCKKETERTTIWGETLDVGVAAVEDIQFSDIQLNGEMIVLTISGPIHISIIMDAMPERNSWHARSSQSKWECRCVLSCAKIPPRY